MNEMIQATYLVETPLEIERVAAIMAGEQSCGTFARVAGETEELRQRAGAKVLGITRLDPFDTPSLESQYLISKGIGGPYTRARVKIAFPQANIGSNLTTLAATVGGNLFDIGQLTGLRLERLDLPASFRSRFPEPVQGISGTRQTLRVDDRPLFGTIIKPNLGLSPEDTAALVAQLCRAGVDFIKDDEVCGNPDHAPLKERVRAVMTEIRKFRQESGRDVLMAFNISDEADAMKRHAQFVAEEGGNCIMASLNWCGLSGIETLRKSTDLILHGHRNGFGAMSRHESLGFGYQAYQVLYRLAGLDHLHVHGLGGKFCNPDEEVADSGRHCLAPLVPGGPDRDRVMPVFSSGQWAGTVAATHEALNSPDFLFLAGGGILAHPDGPCAGIMSMRQAWEAKVAGIDLDTYAKDHPELSGALAFFGKKAELSNAPGKKS